MSVIIHHSLADFIKTIGGDLEQSEEFTIHTFSEIHPAEVSESPLFRANYFSFVLIKSGKGWYTTDNHRFATRDHTLYFTNPGHLKSFGFEERYDSYLITLSEHFLKRNIHPDVFSEFSFMLAETIPAQYLEEPLFNELWQLAHQIYAEYKSSSPLRFKIISNYFMVFLLKVKEMIYRDYDPIEEGGRSSEIVKTFKKDLEQHFRELSTGKTTKQYLLKDFAERQYLHPNYFGTVIKSKTGRSVSEWMAEKMIAETQALLRNTRMPIKEIAYQFGFSEPTHFTKFFKKHTGSTPGAYRNG
ncbi:MAG: AraC family transcriptional regulator [Bacteroidota bacterium]